MMTRRDYRVIVKGFEESWPESLSLYENDLACRQWARKQWAKDVRQVGRALSFDNFKFDMGKFEEATGHYDYLHGGS